MKYFFLIFMLSLNCILPIAFSAPAISKYTRFSAFLFEFIPGLHSDKEKTDHLFTVLGKTKEENANLFKDNNAFIYGISNSQHITQEDSIKIISAFSNSNANKTDMLKKMKDIIDCNDAVAGAGSNTRTISPTDQLSHHPHRPLVQPPTFTPINHNGESDELLDIIFCTVPKIKLDLGKKMTILYTVLHAAKRDNYNILKNWESFRHGVTGNNAIDEDIRKSLMTALSGLSTNRREQLLQKMNEFIHCDDLSQNTHETIPDQRNTDTQYYHPFTYH